MKYVSPTFLAPPILFHACEQCTHSLHSTSIHLFPCLFTEPVVTALAFLLRLSAVAIEGNNWERMKAGLLHISYCIACLLFPQLIGQNHLLFFSNKDFGVLALIFIAQCFEFFRGNAFHTPGSSRVSAWKAFIFCLIVFPSSEDFW